MGVSVPSKRGQQWLRLAGRPSILGQGLLERARATFLGLLGLTAAVGLAIVAIALNQSWPLIAGSSIPQIPPRHQAVGEATVAVGGTIGDADSEQANALSDPGSTTEAQRAEHPGGAGPAANPAPSESATFVVSPSAPAEPQGGDSPGVPEQSPAPTVQPPQQAADTPASPTSSAPASPPAVPPTVAESTPPGATTAGAPASDPEAYLPSWSQGKGHAYGRSDDYEAAGDSRDCDDGDDGGWDHGGDDYHGHRYDD